MESENQEQIRKLEGLRRDLESELNQGYEILVDMKTGLQRYIHTNIQGLSSLRAVVEKADSLELAPAKAFASLRLAEAERNVSSVEGALQVAYQLAVNTYEASIKQLYVAIGDEKNIPETVKISPILKKAEERLRELRGK